MNFLPCELAGLILLSYSTLIGIKEIFTLYRCQESEKGHINNQRQHTLEHIALIGILLVFSVVLLVNNGLGFELFAYCLMLSVFLLPHLIRERVEEKF